MAAAMRRNGRSLFARCQLSSTADLSPNPAPSIADASSIRSSNPITRLKFALRGESDPEKIIALFQSSAHLPRFYSDRPLYQICVHKLTLCRRPDLVERLLESQKSDPAAPKSEGFFIRIMSLYTDANMPDHAAQTFQQIPSPTEHSFCALLTAYHKQQRFERVFQLFDSVPIERGIVPGVAAHNVLLACLCQTGKMDEARNLLDEMRKKKGLEPDIISYNTILNGFFKRGDQDMFDDILNEINCKAIAPNVVTYNLKMANFGKRKESFRAEELLDVMTYKGIYPNLSTFNILIKGFCNERDSDSAMRVFKRMKAMNGASGKERISPSADTYILLIRCLVDKEEFTQALQVCKECLTRRYAPPFETMKGLINGLAKTSKVDLAKCLIEKMRMVNKGDAVAAWTKLEAELLV